MAGGEAPVHLLDSSGGRTPPYHAAADHDHNQASCASRPKPEGSLSAGELREQEQEEDWQWEGHEEEQWEELQQLCRRCHIVMSQLRRQAAALTDRSSLQVRNPVRCSGGWQHSDRYHGEADMLPSSSFTTNLVKKTLDTMNFPVHVFHHNVFITLLTCFKPTDKNPVKCFLLLLKV